MTGTTNAQTRRDHARGIGGGLALAIARPVMIFLRYPETIGFEMLPLGAIVKTMFVLLAISSVTNFWIVTFVLGDFVARGDDWSLRVFALAFGGAGVSLHYRRKREKWNPNRPHRLYPGTSRFLFLPLKEPSHAYRFIDPAVVFLVGALLRMKLGCPMLGLYCMIAACALAAQEWEWHQQTEQHDWVLGDGPKEAARDAEAMKTMAPRAEATSLSTGVAMTTDLDTRLQADIARRKQQRGGEAAS